MIIEVTVCRTIASARKGRHPMRRGRFTCSHRCSFTTLTWLRVESLKGKDRMTYLSHRVLATRFTVACGCVMDYVTCTPSGADYTEELTSRSGKPREFAAEGCDGVRQFGKSNGV